jgi:GT2 family glycosyltransferase
VASVIDVVAVNYKTEVELEEFIASYRRTAPKDSTLTVVDVESFGNNRISRNTVIDEYLFFSENLGYGRACNLGALGGSNEAILLANADTVLTMTPDGRSGLQVCAEALLNGPSDWAVLGPRQVDQQHYITHAGIFGPDQSPVQRGWHEPDHGQYTDIRDDAWSVMGALYFIKRSVWEELTVCPLAPQAFGAFLETRLYFEETFCSLHARAHGWKVVYYGAVTMIHHWHRSIKKTPGAANLFSSSREIYRKACADHKISCEVGFP